MQHLIGVQPSVLHSDGTIQQFLLGTTIWNKDHICAAGMAYLPTIACLSEPCNACWMLAAFFSSCVCFCWRTRSKGTSSRARAVTLSPSTAFNASPKRFQFLRSLATCTLKACVFKLLQEVLRSQAEELTGKASRCRTAPGMLYPQQGLDQPIQPLARMFSRNAARPTLQTKQALLLPHPRGFQETTGYYLMINEHS